jgi:uncharacterized protein YjlB
VEIIWTQPLGQVKAPVAGNFNGERLLVLQRTNPMPLTDQIKNYAKKIVENRPEPSTLRTMVRSRKPQAIRFRDDGIVPNNPRFPALIYRGVVVLKARAFDPGALIDALFETNGWARSWRDTVYDFVHYHSQIHEVMGVARGTAKIECGGLKGRVLSLKAGDECTDTRECADAAKRIAKVPKPSKDPVYGKRGPLTRLWRR